MYPDSYRDDATGDDSSAKADDKKIMNKEQGILN
jgi:hypothetical protein